MNVCAAKTPNTAKVPLQKKREPCFCFICNLASPNAILKMKHLQNTHAVEYIHRQRECMTAISIYQHMSVFVDFIPSEL